MAIKLALIAISAVLISVVFMYCTMQANAKDGEFKITVALLALAAMLCIPWGWYVFGYNSSESIAERRVAAVNEARQQAEKDCEDPWNAFWISKTFVERDLVAPKSAEFPKSLNDDGVRTKYIGECTHEVWSYVDSQNSYGAMIRTNYYVKVQNQKGTDNWKLLDIRM
ncbi:hypothetical protein [Pseudomonas nitroreducens]|uniref:hypothetical protein n=1 Tax=Pseudomonas nitroreducens TaxID=46680 RepID=UPI00351CEAE7